MVPGELLSKRGNPSKTTLDGLISDGNVPIRSRLTAVELPGFNTEIGFTTTTVRISDMVGMSETVPCGPMERQKSTVTTEPTNVETMGSTQSIRIDNSGGIPLASLANKVPNTVDFGEDPHLIILILSCRQYVPTRQKWIRDTWLNDLPGGSSVQSFFVIGRNQEHLGEIEDDNLFVKTGNHTHFSDGGGGAAWKIYASLKFLLANTKCSHFYIVDDDTYVVVDRLLNCGYEHSDYIGRRTWNNDGAYGGPGFFLSRNAAEAITKKTFVRDSRFGDTFCWLRLQENGFHLTRDWRFVRKPTQGWANQFNDKIAIHRLREPEPFYLLHFQKKRWKSKKHTMKSEIEIFEHREVDGIRLTNIYYLLKDLLNTGVDGSIVEIGCFTGMTAALMQHINYTYSDEEPRKMIVIDTFEGNPPPTSKDQLPDGSFTFNSGDFRAYEDEVIHNFISRKLEVPVIKKGKIWDDFSLIYPVCFVHIDVDFYEGTIDALHSVYEAVDAGGVIIVDDYGWEKSPGVTKAVDEFFANKVEKPEELWAGKFGQAYVRKQY